MRFSIGDPVVVKNPKTAGIDWDGHYLSWEPEMDRYDGVTTTVSGYSPAGNYLLHGCSLWAFAEDWLSSPLEEVDEEICAEDLSTILI